MEELIFFSALLAFSYGLVSAVAEKSPITAPMVFVATGMLASPLVFNLFEAEVSSKGVQLIAQFTLILVLFSDASKIDLPHLRRNIRVPLRLLAVGLPLTMVLGILVAVPLFPGMGLVSLALIALILSPTDAALGQVVVTSKKVPARTREAIGVESGLNDGIALPPIMACLAVAGGAAGNQLDFGFWGHFALKQVILGPATGALVGWLGGVLIDRSARRRWMKPMYQQMAAIALALMCYGLAETFGGNGFLAAFFGGLLLGSHTAVVRKRIQVFGDAEGAQLSLFIFLVFGMVMVPSVCRFWDLSALVYALLSLTVIRMLPVGLCLLGTRTDLPTASFIGWFGPRGIASILYGLIMVGRIGFEGHERMLSVIGLTVLLSVFLHGATATWLSKRYGRYSRRHEPG